MSPGQDDRRDGRRGASHRRGLRPVGAAHRGVETRSNQGVQRPGHGHLRLPDAHRRTAGGEFLSDGTTRIHVNLDGIDDPVACARLGEKVNPAVDDIGMTRWEMYQLSTNLGSWCRVAWYRDGKVEGNPFGN